MNKKKCDLLIRNACIVSMNSSRTIFSPGAVAISKSRIVDVGSDIKITQRIDAKEKIDAKGGIVHPGFIDRAIGVPGVDAKTRLKDAILHPAHQQFGSGSRSIESAHIVPAIGNARQR